jgi:AAA15 family ATPase/GTPase
MELNMLKTGLKGLTSNYFDISNKRHLLRSSALYGPNASGKSVFLRAIKTLEFLLERSSGFKPHQPMELYEPHKLEKSFASRPVVFEISFISNETQFDYLVSFSQDRIETEELYYYPTNTKTLLYSRYAEKEMKFGDYYKGAKKTLEKLLLPNQLFLSKAAENNVEALMEPYRFITQKMMVYPFMEDYHESSYARLYARRLAEDKGSAFSKRFNALICAVDTGITSVSAEEVDWSEFKFPGSLSEEIKKRFQEDYKYDIKTKHIIYEGTTHVGDVLFDVQEESSGTKSLFVIGGIIIEALETGSVLVVDEFEKSLHPIITQFLIQLFHNPIVNTRNAQLIFATHDVTQLSNDNFRRDQVWFTEKNEFGATNLFRCSDITGLRLGTPLDKWYATGRLGATPIINDVDFLIEMQSDEQGKS